RHTYRHQRSARQPPAGPPRASSRSSSVVVNEAQSHYIKAIGKGLLKIMSKMGISTLQSYCGAQRGEAVGLSKALIDRHFTGTPSRVGGIGLDLIAEETLRRHRDGFTDAPTTRLDPGGEYQYRA